MSKVIYLTDQRAAAAAGDAAPAGTAVLPPAGTAVLPPAGQPALDTRARPLRDLRISVTDRCNFRCTYCMPRDAFDSNHVFLPHAQLLSFEEMARAAAVFVRLGVRKIRLTGGEPLLRKNIETLVGLLAALRTPEGDPLELTLTTNGSLLARKARALKEAGLTRVTVSMDALDPAMFARMSDTDFPVADVLRGIDAAAQAGLAPVKVNMVVRRGVNDDQILPMAAHFRGSGHILRFIEYMDVGSTNGWNMAEVLPSADVIARIGERFPLTPLHTDPMGRVAQRWAYADGAGEIGVISSVTQAFCEGCTRARLSPEGRLFLCLFASRGHDLRALIRGGADDDQLAAAVAGIWAGRGDNYSERRLADTPGAPRDPKVEMSYIGG
ncbi:molybdenum cofactor biosynthesis protein MoeA [Bordetella sp. H567]|uniref:GTP 3',8-cyclase MoaA n=1 Tax=Bordetella sp. H567 TaxID=1697043 RepID=UPI00081CB673|nr:GTP 3',8-cyclase MoaA [Bordetella sp. H567]AOB33388.1 molybdenum cofactor biosynthesis protein MoeA [Bordetella sp. H567]